MDNKKSRKRPSKKNASKPKIKHSARLTPSEIAKKKQRVEERKKILEEIQLKEIQLEENKPELN